MKTKSLIAWILLVTLILFITCTVAGARTIFYGYGYSDNRDRAHWSIYEGRLVPGDVHYSPYAFNYGQSGLIPDNVQYNMYAFSYGKSGLIYKDSGEPYCPNRQGQSYISSPIVIVVQQSSAFDQVFKQEAEQQKRYQENVEARRKRVEQRKRELAAVKNKEPR